MHATALNLRDNGSERAPPRPGADPAAATRTDWIAVGAVFAAGLVAALQVGKTAIALPALSTDLGLDLREGGWVMAIFGMLGVVASVPAGALVSRLGDRTLQVSGLLAMALGSLLGAFAGSLAALLATRVLEGAGFLLFAVAGASVLQRLSRPADRNLVFSIWSCYMPAGMALALAFGAALQGWRGFWMINAGLCALAAVLLAFGVRAPKAAAAAPWRAIAGDALAVSTARGPLLLALVFALYALQFYAMLSFLPTLLMERMQASTATAGLLSAVAVGSNVIGNLASGRLLRLGAPRWTLIAAASATMGACGVGVFASDLPLGALFALCVLFSTAGGLLPASVIGGAARLLSSPALVAIAVGLLMQGSYLGQVIGPSLIGSVVQSAGWPAAAIPTAIAAGLAIVLAFGLRRAFADER
ncbi:CynX/NimT family MFS transporter [Luteimonas aquatica]|uniref:MFS transporter n=1 Tax=Luteimonas aquatica TaxID=450364 RepID=UPI001F5A0583|nr:MFS transporter [Luteimonas aquatica]